MIIPAAVVKSAQGQDRSNFQAVTPWGGCDFGYVKATESTGFLDATFAANWADLAKAGIPRGAYHFFHPAADARAQARFFVATVKAQGLHPGDFLVADVEITAGGRVARLLRALGIGPRMLPRQNVPAATTGLFASVVDSAAKTFLDEVATLAGPHNPVLVYTNLSVGSLLRSCTGYDLIIAFPSSAAPPSVNPWRNWRMWQWGIVSGIDRDAYNGTTADLHAWIGDFKPKPPAPPKPKPPPPAPAVLPPSLMSGDAMFYLPNGTGAVASYPVPAAVLKADGTIGAPTQIRFGTNAACEVATNVDKAGWVPFAIDGHRSPNAVDLPAGAREVEVQRVDAGKNYVTADFA